jgi:hypothetical protein
LEKRRILPLAESKANSSSPAAARAPGPFMRKSSPPYRLSLALFASSLPPLYATILSSHLLVA